MNGVAFARDALAVWRITRFITEDTLAEPLREAVWDHWGDPSDPAARYTPSYAVTCPHCTSVYVAAGATLLGIVFPKMWTGLSTGLALAAVSSLIEDLRETGNDGEPIEIPLP